MTGHLFPWWFGSKKGTQAFVSPVMAFGLASFLQPTGTTNVFLAEVTVNVSDPDVVRLDDRPEDFEDGSVIIVPSPLVTLTQVERHNSPMIRLRKTGPTDFSDIVGPGQLYPTARFWIQTGLAMTSRYEFEFVSAGGGFANFHPPTARVASTRTVVNALTTGTRIVIALTEG